MIEGDKIRTGEEGGQQHSQDNTYRQREIARFAAPEKILTELSPEDRRVMFFQMQEYGRMKGFYTVSPVPVLHKRHHSIRQSGCVAPFYFQFYNQWFFFFK